MPKRWTVEENEYLQENWGSVSLQTICNNLNRNANAVHNKVQRLELGAFLDSGDYVTMNQFEKAIKGTSSSYANISWIKNRGFPVRFKRVGRCKFRVVYLDEFWHWAEKNRAFIDWSKFERNALGAEPQWAKDYRHEYSFKTKIVKTPWTPTDDERLKFYVLQYKYSWQEISGLLRRTEGAVQRRLCDLGIKARPLKADNHTEWTIDELEVLADCIKKHLMYEITALKIDKSVKAIRGKVYSTYLTENIDKAAALLGNGAWGDNLPERTIKQKLLMTIDEKAELKERMSKFAGLLAWKAREHFEINDFWQKDCCAHWDGSKCEKANTSCDECENFKRLEPQYCVRCGVEFLDRNKRTVCKRCAVARKKQAQKKFAIMNLRGGI